MQIQSQIARRDSVIWSLLSMQQAAWSSETTILHVTKHPVKSASKVKRDSCRHVDKPKGFRRPKRLCSFGASCSCFRTHKVKLLQSASHPAELLLRRDSCKMTEISSVVVLVSLQSVRMRIRLALADSNSQMPWQQTYLSLRGVDVLPKIVYYASMHVVTRSCSSSFISTLSHRDFQGRRANALLCPTGQAAFGARETPAAMAAD